MTVAVRAVYEGGKLRLLDPLDLAENEVVRIAIETGSGDTERDAWLTASRESLARTWSNDEDDVYDALLKG